MDTKKEKSSSEFVSAWREVFTFRGTFSGCMSRKKFWMTFPILQLLCFGFVFLSALLYPNLSPNLHRLLGENFSGTGSPLLSVAAYLFLATGLFFAVLCWTHSVRRLHDTGRTGWWVLLAGKTPFPALLDYTLLGILIFLLSRKHHPDSKKYGESVPERLDIKIAWIAGTLLVVALPIYFS